ncbi:MAG TPA: histidine kinase [Chitinophagaceae bacterium]|nr:histidine kinase [Chitinophagaceae bacterium]
MYSKPFSRALVLILLWFTQAVLLYGQYNVHSDSWKATQTKKSGTITALWYDIEPFIYRDDKGGIIGVEYELMEGFKPFLKKAYGIDLTVNWVDAGAFENIYPYISKSKQPGVFGVSFYSITNERKKEVKFSPPYMADMNIIVTNFNLPVYDSESGFIGDLNRMKGYTMKHTTMEKDLLQLKAAYYPNLPVYNQVDDYEVLRQISSNPNAFGYVPVSIYVVALQRGIKVKRQAVLGTRREGFAAIYTRESDWDEPVNAYFNSKECKLLVSQLVNKYLGEEVAGIILNVSSTDSTRGKPADIDLLTKEREIVTQRLIDTALQVEREKDFRNIALLTGALMIVIAGVVYSRFLVKKRLNNQLFQRNQVIDAQKEQIEEINEQLKMKILQSKLNPHFLFNSLNSIQYFVGMNDRKGALLYLNRFAAFLRNVLKFGDELSITAEEEAGLLEQYLWLEQCRFPGRFDYKVQVSSKAIAHEAQLPPMLVFSLVEDALYLGLLNLEENEKGLLEVVFEAGDNNLIVHVNDNGQEREAALAKKKARNGEYRGAASDILVKRLELFNRRAAKPIEVKHQSSALANTAFVNEVTLVIPRPLFG